MFFTSLQEKHFAQIKTINFVNINNPASIQTIQTFEKPAVINFNSAQKSLLKTIKNTQNNFIKEYYNYWNKSGLRRYKIYYGFLSLKSMYMDIFNYNAKPVLDNLMTIIKNKI